ncbi:hypothetical protein HPC49_33485 [Pyxidicoccus fallax]|uniref:Lipoprotein n=1 Tax=Pyxidicoccus fallax TaxID=394095 RepID=A0A848LMG2_9BACT|nr:hypothetical protein [Pyxidicoccus fallax]NMO18978.1 hypothetical protein [Pyxidicoccus fallax]NPC83122.1 hypothetical protein [Pyxidicoccus fallax]
MHKNLLAVALLCFSAMGCVTAPATAWVVPKERATECRKICTDLDMRMSALVIIHSNAGCVCEPREEEGAPVAKTSGASAAAASAAIQAIEEEQAQASQQHSQNSAHSSGAGYQPPGGGYRPPGGPY